MEEFYVYGNDWKRFFQINDAEPVIIQKFPKFDFFVNETYDHKDTFNVTEGITGGRVSDICDTKKEAIESANIQLSKITKEELQYLIKKWSIEHGISPRYLSKVLPC